MKLHSNWEEILSLLLNMFSDFLVKSVRNANYYTFVSVNPGIRYFLYFPS